jgi:hypothetical protein
LKYFPGNIYQNFITFALADFTGYTLSGFILKYSSLRASLVIAYGTSAFGGILYIFLYKVEYMVPILIVLSKIGVSMSYNIIFISNSKLFPT